MTSILITGWPHTLANDDLHFIVTACALVCMNSISFCTALMSYTHMSVFCTALMSCAHMSVLCAMCIPFHAVCHYIVVVCHSDKQLALSAVMHAAAGLHAMSVVCSNV